MEMHGAPAAPAGQELVARVKKVLRPANAAPVTKRTHPLATKPPSSQTDRTMPYRLQSDDADATAMLRRIATEELSLAAELARTPEAAGRIHDLRKATKKTRGLLRLVAPRFEGFAEENAALRDAAAGIAHLRDAEVMRETLRGISSGSAEAGHMLERLSAGAAHTPLDEALATFAENIAVIRNRAVHWTVIGNGWKALTPGLTKSFAQAQARMAHAQRDPKDTAIHAWRSRTKHHWYHTRLLAPIWPQVMLNHAQIVDDLGELLGKHHDLAVLAEAAPAHLPPEAAKALRAQIRQTQKTQEAEAFRLGSRLFAEPPEALADRWGRWFKLWRAE